MQSLRKTKKSTTSTVNGMDPNHHYVVNPNPPKIQLDTGFCKFKFNRFKNDKCYFDLANMKKEFENDYFKDRKTF